MKIDVIKLTSNSLMADAVKHVFNVDSKCNMNKWYKSEHSPIRTQMFAIYGYDIPYSVIMQMRTHEKNGALFLVEPGRPDTGTERAKNQVKSGNYRDMPRNVFIMCNAQHLIDWSRKRLCNKTEDKTRFFFNTLKDRIKECDPQLAEYMVPNCKYRGMCPEFNSCKAN